MVKGLLSVIQPCATIYKNIGEYATFLKNDTGKKKISCAIDLMNSAYIYKRVLKGDFLIAIYNIFINLLKEDITIIACIDGNSPPAEKLHVISKRNEKKNSQKMHSTCLWIVKIKQ